MNYNQLDKEVQKLIDKDATDKELNDFIEAVADNEIISNEEYNKLLYKVQDTRKI